MDDESVAVAIGIWDDVDWDGESEYQVWYAGPVDEDGEPVGEARHLWKCDTLDVAWDAAFELTKTYPYKNLPIERL